MYFGSRFDFSIDAQRKRNRLRIFLQNENVWLPGVAEHSMKLGKLVYRSTSGCIDTCQIDIFLRITALYYSVPFDKLEELVDWLLVFSIDTYIHTYISISSYIIFYNFIIILQLCIIKHHIVMKDKLEFKDSSMSCRICKLFAATELIRQSLILVDVSVILPEPCWHIPPRGFIIQIRRRRVSLASFSPYTRKRVVICDSMSGLTAHWFFLESDETLG